MADPFDIFGIEPTFAVDLTELEKKHRELSRALHPDRYAGRPAGERRQALSRAIEVNEAWRKLKDPAQRAAALLARLGVTTGETSEPPADPMLLMQIMELREALSDARRSKDLGKVEALERQVKADEAALLTRMAKAFNDAFAGKTNGAGHAALLKSLGELRYYRRFLDEAGAIQDELG